MDFEKDFVKVTHFRLYNFFKEAFTSSHANILFPVITVSGYPASTIHNVNPMCTLYNC